MSATDTQHIVCPHCHTTNRVQAAQLGRMGGVGHGDAVGGAQGCKNFFNGARLQLGR